MFVADTGHQRVRDRSRPATGTFYGQSMTKGDIYTIAGNGTAGYSGDGGAGDLRCSSMARYGVAVDASGNVLIADTDNYRVRVVAAGTGHLLRPGHDQGRHLHHRRNRY